MELEIKHLAPYLPYKLKCKWNKSKPYELIGLRNGNESVNNELWIWKDGMDYGTGYLYECVPILRPLSDLNNEIVINGEKHQMWLLINGQKALENGEIENMNGYQYSILELSYNKIQTILKFHFDIFGLIEKGVAISYNDLK